MPWAVEAAVVFCVVATPEYANYVADLIALDLGIRPTVREVDQCPDCGGKGRCGTCLPPSELDLHQHLPYDLRLLDPGPQRVRVMQIVRAHTDLGLAEAKAFVDSTPGVLLRQTTWSRAEALRVTLKSAGAQAASEPSIPVT